MAKGTTTTHQWSRCTSFVACSFNQWCSLFIISNYLYKSVSPDFSATFGCPTTPTASSNSPNCSSGPSDLWPSISCMPTSSQPQKYPTQPSTFISSENTVTKRKRDFFCHNHDFAHKFPYYLSNKLCISTLFILVIIKSINISPWIDNPFLVTLKYWNEF